MKNQNKLFTRKKAKQSLFHSIILLSLSSCFIVLFLHAYYITDAIDGNNNNGVDEIQFRYIKEGQQSQTNILKQAAAEEEVVVIKSRSIPSSTSLASSSSNVGAVRNKGSIDRGVPVLNTITGDHSNDPNEILYLNVSDAFTLKRKQPTKTAQNNANKYNIDILAIGSVKSIEKANTQMKSWGSHISRRHYWLATEFDDPDPNCHFTPEEIRNISHHCNRKKTGDQFWRDRKAHNNLTISWRLRFARVKWLNAKTNPSGWLCAQKRFTIALSKLMTIYREGMDEHGIELPDYLIFGDDDTYVNIAMMEGELLQKPNKEVKEKQLTLEDELKMVIPTQNVPVVFAGCRIRERLQIVNDTMPFGGFGVLFSKAAIERLIQPLFCNSTTHDSGFEWEACEHFTPAYKDWTISENQYFEDGMSVSDLMGSFTRNLNPFCAHSDWILGYFVNHFNISRHVVPTGHLHSGNEGQSRKYWFNDQMGAVKHSRLHAWNDGSEIYGSVDGNCRNEGDKCDETKGVCHKMTSELMISVHNKVKSLYPGKYRNLTMYEQTLD